MKTFLNVWLAFMLLANLVLHFTAAKMVDTEVSNTRTFDLDEVIPNTIDTVYIDDCDCATINDSRFMQAIIEIETRGISKFQNGDSSWTSAIGDGAEHGAFQITPAALASAKELTGYNIYDMLTLKGSIHIFWFKMGVYSAKYKAEYGEYPTVEQLATMWNGSYNARGKHTQYTKKFQQVEEKLREQRYVGMDNK